MLIEITYNVTDVYMSTTETPVYVEISFEQPGGGAAVWGSITGTLSDQTDLQNALNAKVPYSGATGDVSLGEYGINVGNVIYDTTPTGIPTDQGATYWDADAETVALIMNGTIQKIGEDTFYHVRNTTGSTIAKGTAVRFSGTTGNSGRLLIAPMLADGTHPSQYYMGITSEELVNNADGKVYHFGKMRNINTSAFADGDVLYVSSSVAGALTATAPVAPNNIIVAAAVVHAANNGTLMIRATLASNINADEGVLLTTPTANQGLFYDSGLWVNKSITTALGYTPANAATTLTINGVTYDLSTSRTWTVAAGISGSGASGQVTYWTGASAVSGSNNLFWDNANGRLGIGSSTFFNITTGWGGNGLEQKAFLISSASNKFTALVLAGGASNNGGSAIQFVNYTGTPIADFGTADGSEIGFAARQNTANINFYTTPSGTLPTRRLSIFASGNVGIGGTLTSDPGTKLFVSGDTLLRGSGATSATTALTVQNSSSTNLFVVRNDGNVGIGTNAPTNALEVVGATSAKILIKSTTAFVGLDLQRPAISQANYLSFKTLNTFDWSIGLITNTSDLGIINFSTGNTIARFYKATSNILFQKSGVQTDIASAILQVSSTTQGFLPPRMTTTEKNAIATPAAGLVVYDTTLNKLCVYTTAWETITSV